MGSCGPGGPPGPARWASTGGGRRPGSGNAAAWATAAENKLMGYGAAVLHLPPHRPRCGGQRRLADARHGAMNGHRRAKPCGVCTPAAAAHRRRTARDARETRASGPGQTGWTRLQSAPTHAHRGRTRGLKPLCSLALSLAGKKKGFSTLPRTLAITDRGDRIRTCDLVLPKQTFRGLYDWDFRPQLAW